ncbi:hypothetical protein AKO1_013139 [Acrasis kona]|uniref:START domain-containing protein n=1 Tax=Acrasis kona TaxID=1008807 RepID=A0AAW2YM51_9EUKA
MIEKLECDVDAYFAADRSQQKYDITELGDYDMTKLQYVTLSDVKFLLNLSKDGPHWKTLSVKPATYKTCNKTNLGDRHPEHFYKCIGLLPYSAEDVLNVLADLDTRSAMDNHLYTNTELDYIHYKETKEGLSSLISLETYPLAWPIKNRDFVTAHSIVRLMDGSVVYIRKSVQHPKAPKHKGTSRGTLLCGWILRKIGEESTRYIKVFFRDMYGKSNKLSLFFDAICATHAKNVHSLLNKAVGITKANGQLKYNGPVLKTLRDFEGVVNSPTEGPQIAIHFKIYEGDD